MACGGNCEGCSQTCDKKPLKETLRHGASVKKVIGVLSGKGGVGKSFVAGALACALQKAGHRAAVLDADITGPSVPTLFGLSAARAEGEGEGDAAFLDPVVSKTGVQLMSMNFLLQNESDPVVWRGPIISGAVRQFWTDVMWRDVDFMVVDMPPGTGDVPLTVFQSLPVDAIVVVSSPQDLVKTIVEKAVNMANMMNIPILGLVENMSYVKCPGCGREIKVFGDSHIEEIGADLGLKVLARIPLAEAISAASDKGALEDLEVPELAGLLKAAEAL